MWLGESAPVPDHGYARPCTSSQPCQRRKESNVTPTPPLPALCPLQLLARHYMTSALLQLALALGSLDIFGDVTRLVQVRVYSVCSRIAWTSNPHTLVA